MDFAISAASVHEAAKRVRPYIHRTPVMTSRSADERAGARIFFKCENLQRGGSFKIRGAANRILAIPDDARARGVVAFSSGNHAQAVALVSQEVGIQATIVMPTDAPRSKVEATRARGAQIVTYDRLTEDREEIATRILTETGATLVPPFDDPFVMAGQGTAALELMEEIPDLDALVICVGGGGLFSGCAVSARSLNPEIRLFGVEPERANDVWQSVAAGRRVTIAPPDTIADGLRTLAPGRLTFPVVQSLAERILLVTEAQILDAMRWMLARVKILVEPSGAVGAAAVFARSFDDAKRVGVILSGGNVDREFLVEHL